MCFGDRVSVTFLSCSFFVEETPLCSILCSLHLGVSWNIKILHLGFKGIFVAFLLASLRAFFRPEILHGKLYLVVARQAYL